MESFNTARIAEWMPISKFKFLAITVITFFLNHLYSFLVRSATRQKLTGGGRGLLFG